MAELADWLQLNPSELEWFADIKFLNRFRSASDQLHHYHYRLVQKRSGNLRLIEAPKGRMKLMQRRILGEILDRIPAHPAAHGFVPYRSIRTFAEPHVGQEVVLRLDLKDFFPSIRRARVQSIFRTLGYPESVADLLGGICTNAAPRRILDGVSAEDHGSLRALYEQSHLPQGSPTSPALANTCAYRLDCRLSGLAHAAGGNYTRYADDLAFSGSGDFARGLERFEKLLVTIVGSEGFSINPAKTRVMQRSQRQHLAGVVVNECTNVGRAEFDQLKAILTNCVRHGAAAENRAGLPFWRQHLEGRIAHVHALNPDRAARLSRLLGQVVWE